MPPKLIDQVAEILAVHSSAAIATLAAPILSLDEFLDPEDDAGTVPALQGDDEDAIASPKLAAAWQVIRSEVPGYTVGLSTGLRTIVPLEPDPGGSLRASTARHAFGSVASAPAAPAELAVIIVHEFQHGKLGALLDLIDLFDPADPATLRVGWRPDPRPIEGVLQGVYAHAAVADIWRVRAERDGTPLARQAFAKYHGWVTAAVDALRGTEALTPLGHRFVDRLGETMSAWSRTTRS